MKRAKKKESLIAEAELEINKFSTLNTFGPHADDPPDEFRTLNNFDIYNSYIKERRGSVKFSSALVPDKDILEKVVFDAGDDEYVIIQQNDGSTSSFRSLILDGSAALWEDVVNKTALTSFTLATTDKADMFVSNGKVYIFSLAGNAILEFDSTNERFVKRKLGLPAPQIVSALEDAAAGDLKGKRVYAVELVYKDDTDATLLVSGPNRVKYSAGAEPNEGSLAYTLEGDLKRFVVSVSDTSNDGTSLFADENDNWTHIRLYRSKDITTATTTNTDFDGEAEIIGQPDELYQVQEMTKAALLATWTGTVYQFPVDNVLDDDIPFPLDVITESRLDLYPMPNAELGSFHNNRVWVSGVLNLPGPEGTTTPPSTQSKIFYSPETDTIYSESMRLLNAIESDPGDGQKMKKLISYHEDLIGIKEGKTGRVRNGTPGSGWVTEDEVTGITDKEFAQYVPNVGICARVNDQKDFKIFGKNLQWSNIFSGRQISRPIREIIKQYTNTDVDFLYMNGKLMISGGEGELLVLATEQQAGWSKYIYPLQDSSEAVFTFAEGSRAIILNAGQYPVEIEAESSGEYVVYDYNSDGDFNSQISLGVTTYRFQDNHGRSLIEERFLSVVAKASHELTAQSYVNGKEWADAFGLLLDPVYYPDAALTETEYQGYQEVRALGNYIHYEITTIAPCTIYSIMLNCLIQRNSIRPGFDPFQVLEDAVTEPNWASPRNTITETGSAADTITETGSATDTITELKL